MTGITFLTFCALLAGLAALSLTHLIALKRNGRRLTRTVLHEYAVQNWPETTLGTICAFVLWLGMPELAASFPDVAAAIGLKGERTVLSSFICGFVGNVLADLLGGRVQTVDGRARIGDPLPSDLHSPLEHAAADDGPNIDGEGDRT